LFFVLYIYNLQETLRVKDDELHQLLQDIRARDATIREITDKLQETAEAAETAASAAHSIDEQRRFLSSGLERLKQDQEKQIEFSLLRVIAILVNLYTMHFIIYKYILFMHLHGYTPEYHDPTSC
jgi:peptide deformylase